MLNLTNLKTPGVYIDEIPMFPPSIAAVSTAIPAFIGYTASAKEDVDNDLKRKPKRITSLVDYERYFGGPQLEKNIRVTITELKDTDGNITSSKALAEFTGDGRSPYIMYYALQLYFANGGGPCYVVSVGPYVDLPGALVEKDLSDGLDALAKENEPTLIVFPEAQRLSIGDYKTLQKAALKQCADLKDRFVIMDLHGKNPGDLDLEATVLNDAAKEFRDNGTDTDNLMYGAVYAPNLETTIDYQYDPGAVVVKINAGADAALSSLSGSDNRHYEQAKAALRDLSCNLPPSSAIAGIYVTVDNDRGVWKAPANVGVAATIKPTIACSAAEQGTLNVDSDSGKSINVIRAFTGRGTLVWGARTLDGNSNDWRYINVRRFFNMVEESTKNAMVAFTFEPNDANTWVRAQAMIENFLTVLWRQGALQGIKPEHAFFVSVGLGKTMTALDILEGRMIVKIGMAAVRPAEFIVLQFTHMMAQS